MDDKSRDQRPFPDQISDFGRHAEIVATLPKQRPVFFAETASFERPLDFDAAVFLIDAIARMPGVWQIEVLLRCYSDGLHWISRFLVRLGLPLRVPHLPVLTEALRERAHALLQMLDAPVTSAPSP